MKQLSSRWVLTALLLPALLVVSVLIYGVEAPEASAASGKGFLEIALTGFISSNNNFPSFQSVLLNVIAVRLHPSNDPGVSENDPGWVTVSVPNGSANAEAFPALTFGGNFGPNGNAVGVGQGRSEIQIDLAQIQGSIVLFNIGRVKAQAYGQIELELDPAVQGNVVPRCGLSANTGEGCITYPLQFTPGFIALRQAASAPGGLVTVTRNQTQILAIDINPQLDTPATQSGQPVFFNPQICSVPVGGQNGIPCSFTGNVPPQDLDNVAAVIMGTVDGAKNSTLVNAELSGTSRLLASVKVDKKTHNYTMTLPPGTYDFFISGGGVTSAAISNLTLTAGLYSNQNGNFAADQFPNFSVKGKGAQPISGTVVDACSGLPLQGATVNVYAPPAFMGDPNNPGAASPCPSPSPSPVMNTVPGCPVTCGDFTGSTIPNGCVVIASAATGDTGAYPLPGNATNASAIKSLPRLEDGQDYALQASASGYNSVLIGASAKSSSLFKCGSGLKNGKCNFSLPRGELDVQVNRPIAGFTPPALNVMVNVEDHLSSIGEGVGMVNVPGGLASNSVAVPIFVPAANTPTATPSATPTPGKKKTPTPTPTGTPVTIGPPASYDLFAAVQDLFDKSPQKVGGHTYAVRSDVAVPAYCGGENVVIGDGSSELACVGHGSVAGILQSGADQNTIIALSKTDSTTSNPVIVQANAVPQIIGNQDFSICAPIDSYTASRYEAQPTGSPVLNGTPAPVPPLTGPILISPTSVGTPTPAPCNGICSDNPTLNGSSSCYLCQDTQASPVTLP